MERPDDIGRAVYLVEQQLPVSWDSGHRQRLRMPRHEERNQGLTQVRGFDAGCRV